MKPPSERAAQSNTSTPLELFDLVRRETRRMVSAGGVALLLHVPYTSSTSPASTASQATSTLWAASALSCERKRVVTCEIA